MTIHIGPEGIEQIKFVLWIREFTDLPIFMIPNHGKRTYSNAVIQKKMGMRPGVCDLFIPRATKEYHGTFIEMKSKTGKLSAAQSGFIDEMIQEGYFAIAVWDATSAIEVVSNLYGEL